MERGATGRMMGEIFYRIRRDVISYLMDFPLKLNIRSLVFHFVTHIICTCMRIINRRSANANAYALIKGPARFGPATTTTTTKEEGTSATILPE